MMLQAVAAIVRRRKSRLPLNVVPCCLVQSLSTTAATTRQQEREAERAAKRARREAMAKKRAEIEAYAAKSSIQTPQQQSQEEAMRKESVKQQQQEELQQLLRQHEQRREELLQEASALSLSLYRTCLRSVKVMRPGNEHDEQQFQEREATQMQALEEALSQGDFSMSPPVDRDNELSSRSQYYHAWTRESFEQESDCLDKNPWRMENLKRYLYFLRNGEYRRKWVLKDYKFPDPYPNSFDRNRVKEFERQARELLRDSYKVHGWELEDEETGQENGDATSP